MYMKFLRWALIGVIAQSAMAQSGSGRLYDPEPPADSAYLRTVVAGSGAAVDVVVDGRVRVHGLPNQEASEYLVLTEGRHVIALHAPGTNRALVSKSLEIVKAKSQTLVFQGLKADAAITVIDDKGNSNKLKSLLAGYNLTPNGDVVDIVTADGRNKVFAGLGRGVAAFLQVNPIAVELMVQTGGSTARVKLDMLQGATYSVMLFTEPNGKPKLKVFQSRVERYTGS